MMMEFIIGRFSNGEVMNQVIGELEELYKKSNKFVEDAGSRESYTLASDHWTSNCRYKDLAQPSDTFDGFVTNIKLHTKGHAAVFTQNLLKDS
nr:hypothetical protein [Tanacetum cinerariifolium]